MPDPIVANGAVPKVISAKDDDIGDFFPADFLKRYEVHSYRNASRILAYASPTEMAELIEALMAFKIGTAEMVAKGGNKSQIAKNMDDLLIPCGWHETRITGDLLVTKTSRTPNPAFIGKGHGQKTIQNEEPYKIKGFIDGHKIDFVKERLAFDMEWNSKDQTFDRDLYAARTFYECGIINAGVLLTRSKQLAPVFAEIGNRVKIANFKSKYGASTTWMGKLLYRLDAGRGGGCPILALGIRPAVVEDFEDWKAAHPVISQEVDAQELIEGEEEDESEDEA
jgi:hypothetical protein